MTSGAKCGIYSYLQEVQTFIDFKGWVQATEQLTGTVAFKFADSTVSIRFLLFCSIAQQVFMPTLLLITNYRTEYSSLLGYTTMSFQHYLPTDMTSHSSSFEFSSATL
jgi:hypothetical protein